MITKQMKAAIKILPVSTSSRVYGVLCKNTSGSLKYVCRLSVSNGSFLQSSFTTSNMGGIWLGSGNTAPTEDDYNLEQRITSGLSSVNVTDVAASGIDENGNLQQIFSIAVRNTSSSAITVSEIGMVVNLYGSSTQGGSVSYDYYMVDRTVLDAPIVIEPNDIGYVQYKFTIGD